MKGGREREGRNGRAHLQRITPIRLPINHVEQLLVYPLSCTVTHRPVVSCSSSVCCRIDVLGVVEVGERGALDVVDDLREERGEGKGARDEERELVVNNKKWRALSSRYSLQRVVYSS